MSAPVQLLHPKKNLPNVAGFKFVALYFDNTLKEQEVQKNENGLHFIEDSKNVKGFLYLETLEKYSVDFIVKAIKSLEWNEIRNKFTPKKNA